jgi:hypothetical protein
VFEVFFGGARGGGKTDGMLGEWASHADLYGVHAIGLVVRRERTQLVEAIERSRRRRPTFPGPAGLCSIFCFSELFLLTRRVKSGKIPRSDYARCGRKARRVFVWRGLPADAFRG